MEKPWVGRYEGWVTFNDAEYCLEIFFIIDLYLRNQNYQIMKVSD